MQQISSDFFCVYKKSHPYHNIPISFSVVKKESQTSSVFLYNIYTHFKSQFKLVDIYLEWQNIVK